MKSKQPSQTLYGPFPEFFRKRVHHLLSWGYEDARLKLQSSDEYEPAITGFITKAIKERLRSPDCPKWAIFYSVYDDPPVEKEGSSGRSRPRVDLIIECALMGRPEFMFEAKRLRKKSVGSRSLGVSSYIGSDGMGCFINGLYASRYDEAAMLGYVQSDSLVYWQEKIKKKIDDSADALNLTPPQQDVVIIDAFELEWTSTHERANMERPITIYHILLVCFPDASSPAVIETQ